MLLDGLRLDPFCQIAIGKTLKRTQTQQQAGKNPIFTETFTFYTRYDYIMKIGVFNDETDMM